MLFHALRRRAAHALLRRLAILLVLHHRVGSGPRRHVSRKKKLSAPPQPTPRESPRERPRSNCYSAPPPTPPLARDSFRAGLGSASRAVNSPPLLAIPLSRPRFSFPCCESPLIPSSSISRAWDHGNPSLGGDASKLPDLRDVLPVSFKAVTSASMKEEYPERLGQPECQNYLKSGTCNFGPKCKFHHPREKAGIQGMTLLNTLGYPHRPNERDCAYYLKTGQCKYGNTCKFNHPELFNVVASSHGSPIYPFVHTSPSTRPHSYTGPTMASWTYPRGYFVPSPRWQSPPYYAPMIVPHGLVQVPRWNSYHGQMLPISSSEIHMQSLGAQQYYGTSLQGESAGIQGMLSPYRSNSFAVPQYEIQEENVFPERPDQPECIYYMKTGDCKYGSSCKFHHPRVRSELPTRTERLYGDKSKPPWAKEKESVTRLP